MKFYRLCPEVAGEIGENSKIVYKNGIIEDVTYLHYEFAGWLGDELLTQTPCFIVTAALSDSIIQSNLTGYKLEKMEVSVSDEFKEFYPDKIVPEFVRLIPLGKLESNNRKDLVESNLDFNLEDNVELVVSENALKIIKQHKLLHCDIQEV